MNEQPVYYMQTDARWKNNDYSTTGESTTIAESGCGPSCAAMLIETITGKTFTPADACAWSLKHGYKACKQGTYYSYFPPQFKAYGIACEQLGWENAYGNPNHSVHKKAFDLLKQGYYLIACMGKGTWTKSGHFIVVWWENGKVRINDPASKASARTNGDLSDFKSQVKYYWAIDARKHNGSTTTSSSTTTKKGSDTVTITLPILKKGSTGASVKALQQLLTAKGYSTVGIDGSFGVNTLDALKKFQKAKGLEVDGYCGKNTWTVLLTK